MLKECPKCKHDMVRLSPGNALDEKWACLNPDCNYSEIIHQLDKLREEAGQKPE